MKLKKLFIALMMVTVVAVAGVLTACGDVKPITDKAEALEMLTEVAQKQNDLKNYSAEMTMETEEGGIKVSMTSNIKMKDGEFTMTSNMAGGGMTMEMKMYYTGGYFYTDSLGTKTKMELDFEKAVEEIMGEGSSEINEDMIDTYDTEDWTYEGKADGKLHVFVFSNDEYGTMTMKVNKNKQIVYTCLESEDMKMEATYNYSTPKLDFPSDLDTYTENSDFDWENIFG